MIGIKIFSHDSSILIEKENFKENFLYENESLENLLQLDVEEYYCEYDEQFKKPSFSITQSTSQNSVNLISPASSQTGF